jgi:hypothetical protein
VTTSKLSEAAQKEVVENCIGGSGLEVYYKASPDPGTSSSKSKVPQSKPGPSFLNQFKQLIEQALNYGYRLAQIPGSKEELEARRGEALEKGSLLLESLERLLCPK